MTELFVSWMKLKLNFELWIVAKLFQNIQVCNYMALWSDINRKRNLEMKKKIDGLLSEKKMIVHFTTPLNTLEAFFTCSLCLYGSIIEFWFYIYSFQLHLSCHVWFNLFVLCLLDFSFVNLVLDTFLRFYFVCYPL